MEQTSKTKTWSAERIVHEIMALWFGSVHAMKMVSEECLKFNRLPLVMHQLISALAWINRVSNLPSTKSVYTQNMSSLCGESSKVRHTKLSSRPVMAYH